MEKTFDACAGTHAHACDCVDQSLSQEGMGIHFLKKFIENLHTTNLKNYMEDAIILVCVLALDVAAKTRVLSYYGVQGCVNSLP